MRIATLLLALSACESTDDAADDDGPTDGGDTDDGDDTDDTDGGDTDPSDTDTDLPPPEDFCEFTQCGGDVVGAWNIVGGCFDFPLGWEAVCPTATEETVADLTGTFVFDADYTYTIAGTAGYTITVTLPAECNTLVTDCSDWEGGASAIVAPTVCTGDVAVACTCVTTIPQFPLTDSGTWEYMGEDVRIESQGAPVGEGGGFPTVYEVCLEEPRLQLRLKGPFGVGYTLER